MPSMTWEGRAAVYSLLGALIVNAIFVAWLASKIDTKAELGFQYAVQNALLPEKVEQNERQVERITKMQVDVSQINTKLAVLTSQLERFKEDIRECRDHIRGDRNR